jgi:MFS family permease
MSATEQPLPTAPRTHRWPTAAPDGLVAATLLAFLATAGLFYVNIMAALVSGLVEGMNLTTREAGFVGSANTYGAAIGSLVAVFVGQRVAWRPVALAALILLIGIDLLSPGISHAPMLIAVRFIHGCIGGLLVGLSFTVIARTASPDRTFGMLLVVQFGLGGLATMTLPKLVPAFGHQILFWSLAAFSFVTVLMVPFLHDYPVGRIQRTIAAGPVRWPLLIPTLAALFLFQAANMGLFAYILGLAKHSGLSLDDASTAVGLSTWVGISGSLLVVVFGSRFGRHWPLVAGMLLTLGGTLAFHWSSVGHLYMLANCATSITWAFVMAYLLGLCASFDTTGRTAAIGGFVSKMGLASGPFIGALFLGQDDYATLINMAVLAFALSIPLMLYPARVLDAER